MKESNHVRTREWCNADSLLIGRWMTEWMNLNSKGEWMRKWSLDCGYIKHNAYAWYVRSWQMWIWGKRRFESQNLWFQSFASTSTPYWLIMNIKSWYRSSFHLLFHIEPLILYNCETVGLRTQAIYEIGGLRTQSLSSLWERSSHVKY